MKGRPVLGTGVLESETPWLKRQEGAAHRRIPTKPIRQNELALKFSGLDMESLHRLSWFTLERRFNFPVPLPDREDRRVDDQLHEKRRNNAAEHRCRDALHDIGTRPRGPHDRKKSEEHTGNRHDFGPQPLDRSVNDRFAQIVP